MEIRPGLRRPDTLTSGVCPRRPLGAPPGGAWGSAPLGRPLLLAGLALEADPAADGRPCPFHYARNLLSQVPKSAQPWVATLLRIVFEQPDADAVQAQMTHVLDALEAKFPKAAALCRSKSHRRRWE